MSPSAFVANGELTIVNATSEDSGIYECSTSTGEKDRVRLNVMKERVAVHEIRTYLNEEIVHARLGQNVEQTCTSMTNSGDLQIRWFNHNKKV